MTKYIYVLANPEGALDHHRLKVAPTYKTGGGSSTSPQTRLYETLEEARKINRTKFKDRLEIHKFNLVEELKDEDI